MGRIYAGLLSQGVYSSKALWTNLNGKGNTFRIAQVDGQVFHDIFEINGKYLPNGELVDLHEDYSNAKCFLTDDGLAGFAIEPDGNLVSVFSLNPADIKEKQGFLYAIKDFIREQGATHLDAYMSENQPLQKIYEKTLGFELVATMDYNMEYDHDDIAKNHGNPQIAFMSRVDEGYDFRDYYQGAIPNFDDYDEAVKWARETGETLSSNIEEVKEERQSIDAFETPKPATVEDYAKVNMNYLPEMRRDRVTLITMNKNIIIYHSHNPLHYGRKKPIPAN